MTTKVVHFAALILLVGFTQWAWGAVAQAAPEAQTKDSHGKYIPRTRHYYIAAQDVMWDFMPSGKNEAHPMMGTGVWGKKHIYPMTRYIGYTDATFTKKKPQPASLGILGPVIRAVVGDTIKVTFKNMASQPYSIHPIGTTYTKANEGAHYAGLNFLGQSVAPGKTYTYTWVVAPQNGPGPNDPSSILLLYRSHVDPVGDLYRGLVGPMIITSADHANPDATPDDVDREFVAMFLILNENKPGEEEEGDLMHSINGYVFGNLPGLVMNQGEHVRWYVFGMGTETDIHSPHWHGNGVFVGGHRREVLWIGPAVTRVADMYADNPGTWMFKCMVGDHMTAGMMALYTVKPK